MNSEQLINIETAKLAKEKGFDWGVINCYNENGEIRDKENITFNYNQFMTIKGSNVNMYSAIEQSLLQRWLRDMHKIHVNLHPRFDNFNEFAGWNLLNLIGLEEPCPNSKFNFSYETYEEALEAGLFEALKLIK